MKIGNSFGWLFEKPKVLFALNQPLLVNFFLKSFIQDKFWRYIKSAHNTFFTAAFIDAKTDLQTK